MSIRGFEITKGTTGASESANADKVSALLVNAPSVAAAGEVTGVANNTAYRITKLKDAETMGLTAAYDTANNVRVHRHISEFYRMAGEGTPLWLMICTDTLTMKEMIVTHGLNFLAEAKGEIKRIGVCYNPGAGYTPVALDGLETVVRESLAPAQAFHESSWNTDRPMHVILEGRGVGGTVASVLDLRNITEGTALLEATHVTLCIGQDYDYADNLAGEAKKFADVGTLLGTKAYLPVNRSAGEVETIDISDATKSVWLNAGLSDHTTIKSKDADLADYSTKGYVFGMSYTDIPGLHWNGDHVCSPEGVDDDGFIKISTMGHAAVINKAARELRKRLLPKVKSTVPVDTETGLLPVPMIKYFEGLGDAAIGNEKGTMVKAGEISGGKTTVDPESNLFEGEKSLDVEFYVVPTATVDKIKGTINLKKSL